MEKIKLKFTFAELDILSGSINKFLNDENEYSIFFNSWVYELSVKIDRIYLKAVHDRTMKKDYKGTFKRAEFIALYKFLALTNLMKDYDQINLFWYQINEIFVNL
jgi:hypothetical protein